MGTFFQVLAAVLVAAVLGVMLSRQAGELSVLLTLAAGCMVLWAALSFLQPVVEFWEELQRLGGLNQQWVTVLLKAAGIAIVGELASMVCTDAGNASLAKAVGVLTAAAMLWLAIPLLRGLLELVVDILGEP